MAVYETSFLGEPIKAKKVRKSPAKTPVSAPAPAIEPVAEESKPKPKRVAKRKVVEPEVDPAPQVQVEVQKKKKTAPVTPSFPIKASPIKKIIDGKLETEAPSWFKTFLHEEAKRRNNKKPKSEKVNAVELKATTDAAVKEKWSDEITKPKVMQVDHKMNNMYRQIFGK